MIAYEISDKVREINEIGKQAKEELRRLGISICAHICSIGTVTDERFLSANVIKSVFEKIASHAIPVIDKTAEETMLALICSARRYGKSYGGLIECAAVGVDAGIGRRDRTLESAISEAVFAHPSVRGIEFGAGFATSAMTDGDYSERLTTDGISVMRRSNNRGGITDGVSNGMPIVFRAAVCPDSSLPMHEKTTRKESFPPLSVLPFIEAAAAYALLDAIKSTGNK